MANVVFDQQSAERIAKAVKYVEGLQQPEPPVADEADIGSGGRTVIRGTFTGEWAKNTAKDVAFTADNGDSGTKPDVFNYFTDVGANSATTDCVIMQAGSEWVLVSAEPAAECVPVSTIQSTSNVTVLSGVTISGATVVTGVQCVDGNLTVYTADLSSLVTINSATVSVAGILNTSTSNLTLPRQRDCG